MPFIPQEQYCYVSLDYDASLADPAFQVNFSPVCLQYQQSHNNHTFLKSKLSFQGKNSTDHHIQH